MNAQEEAVKKVLEEEDGLKEEDVKVDAPKAPPRAQQQTNQPGPHVFGFQYVEQFLPFNWNAGAMQHLGWVASFCGLF
jgi:hypothetical protein